MRSHICRKFPVGNTSSFELQKKRRRKENARKSRQRKRERLISRAANIIRILSSTEVSENFLKEVDGKIKSIEKSVINLDKFVELKKQYDKEPLKYLVSEGVFPEEIRKVICVKLNSWDCESLKETVESSSDDSNDMS